MFEKGVLAVRQFKCTVCGHSLQLPFCNGRSGRDLTCPQCGGKTMQRTTAPAVQAGEGTGGYWRRGGGGGCAGNHGKGRKHGMYRRSA